MSSKPVFIDYQTKICSNFLNPTADAVWDALKEPKTPNEARVNIGAASQTAVDTKNNSQDAAIALKADTTYVDSKNAVQDANIALKADKNYVDAKNATQDTAIASKAETSYVDSQNAAQDATIALKADITYVDAENSAQDTVISLKADIAYVDAEIDALVASGIPDGDKGDIVVSASGATWLLDSAVVTPAAKTVLDDTTVGAMVNTLGGAASTGSGGLVRVTSPTLVTPALGTPASGNLVNCTGIADTGKNRIINGDFRVNQRGVSGTVTLVAYAFGLDRWQAVASGCTYTLATVDGLTTLDITAGSLRQVIEFINVPTGVNQCTLSWIGTAQGKIGAGSLAASPITASVTGGSNLVVEFSTGTLANVQFELGSVATPFCNRSHSIEAMLCKRYYQNIGKHFQIYGSGYAPAIAFDIPVNIVFPVSMAAIPTVTSSAAWTVSNCGQPIVNSVGPDGFHFIGRSIAIGAVGFYNGAGCYWMCSAEI